ncbi:MAG: signal recognition particle-docking protein FtsY [Pirellula sp.]|jgi:fused signal recognition particle receptor|nr:signal recognition particle-docking protein FtsY [Pirellula sp.]
MVFWRKKKEPPTATESVEGGVQTAGSQTTKVSWFRKVLEKTNQLLRTDIRDLWKDEGRLVDETFLSDLYAILVRTDMGASMATTIVDSVRRQYASRKVEMEEVLSVVRERVSESLKSRGGSLRMAEQSPTIILVVGVNGSGKTTSIAKLASKLTRAGNRVLLAAGDTFRAAAVAQLRVWSERIGCDIVLGEQGADPGSVVFRAVQRAVDESYDVCIIDTAGRLQTQSNLMQQLEKIKRVIQKQVPEGPHEVLLVLDATAGQNAISQAKGFSDAANCTGIILAKLDGTAKGGVIIPIAEQFGLPVKFIGVGEQLTDLEEFVPDEFSSALFS